MKRSRAAFKAMREMVGMTQRDLADALGVQERSVRRWEASAPDTYNFPPGPAWALLEDALAKQAEIVSFAVSKAQELEDAMGHAPDAVEVKYWLSQAAYASFSTDTEHDVAGSYRMANANARAAAAALMDLDYRVQFVDGAGNVLVPDSAVLDD